MRSELSRRVSGIPLTGINITIKVWKEMNNLHVHCIYDCTRSGYFVNRAQPLFPLVRAEIVADPYSTANYGNKRTLQITLKP